MKMHPLFIVFGAIVMKDSVLPVIESISTYAQNYFNHKSQIIQRLDEQEQVDHELIAQKKAQEAENEGGCTHAIGFTADDYGEEEAEEEGEEDE